MFLQALSPLAARDLWATRSAHFQVVLWKNGREKLVKKILRFSTCEGKSELLEKCQTKGPEGLFHGDCLHM